MNQSHAPKVRQRAKSGKLTNESLRRLMVYCGLPSLSWRTESRRNKYEATMKNAKVMITRTRKNSQLRYPRFESSTGSSPTGTLIQA